MISGGCKMLLSLFRLTSTKSNKDHTTRFVSWQPAYLKRGFRELRPSPRTTQLQLSGHVNSHRRRQLCVVLKSHRLNDWQIRPAWRIEMAAPADSPCCGRSCLESRKRDRM